MGIKISVHTDGFDAVKEAIAKTKEYIQTSGLGRVKVNFGTD